MESLHHSVEAVTDVARPGWSYRAKVFALLDSLGTEVGDKGLEPILT